MDRIILHSDMNNFFASVECLYNPKIRNLPVAVAGSTEMRHGIVLAKNDIAKKFGIQTAEPVWAARQKCPEIVFVSPQFDRYVRFSNLAKEIYMEYTNQVENFGLDECWLDVSSSGQIAGDGKEIADNIRKRIKFELGITASIGVSFNKIFAKLGSDMKKPDATTVITKENFKETVWKLPVCDLLYVGHSTYNKLKNFNINTIGELAVANTKFLQNKFGKQGITLWQFANGYDNSPVANISDEHLVKSVGNSTTLPRDLTCDSEVKVVMYALAESVAMRLRELHLVSSCIQISIRDSELYSYERQGQLSVASSNSSEIFAKAFELYKIHHTSKKPIRSIGVRGCKLSKDENRQLSLFPEDDETEKNNKLEKTIDGIRNRFGHDSIGRGIMLGNTDLTHLSKSAEQPFSDDSQ